MKSLSPFTPSCRRRGLLGFLLAAVVLLALLPWFRNHTRLNHFYDYGPVIAAVGRINAGERPYDDFVTPIQMGTFLFNGLSESLSGPTYQGMTRGYAVLMVAAMLGMAWLLSRRWPPVVAVLLAGALASASLSQHTIVWPNAWGVLLLALVTWSGATAPVFRRADRGWNLLTAFGLVLGGLNEISFQLVAMAFAIGWPLRSALLHRASWPRSASTIGAVVGCGWLLPLIIELAWTGASFGQWWYNVVGLRADGLPDALASILRPGFYLNHLHNDYGRLALPAVGLIGVLLTAVVIGIAVQRMPERASRGECALLLLAGLLALGGGIGLLAAHQEIAYVSLAGWLVLLIAIWMAFGLPARGLLFHAGLMAPVLVVGGLAWHAAWAGQRALGGDLPQDRRYYTEGAAVGAGFGYLRGTLIPPELGRSLEALSHWRSMQGEEVLSGIFYGPGAEWLERIWPTKKVPGMPLWLAHGTSYGPTELRLLAHELGPGGSYRGIVLSDAGDIWLGETRTMIESRFSRQRLGPLYTAYERVNSEGVSIHPLNFIALHGGNVDSNLLRSAMSSYPAAIGRPFLGVRTGSGEMTLLAPSYRLRGEAVLRRLPGNVSETLHAEFTIAALPESGEPIITWARKIEIPRGQEEVRFPYETGGGGMPVQFTVTIPPEDSDRLVAGWAHPTLQHAMETSDDVPRIHLNSLSFSTLGEEEMAALLPGAWRPVRIVARGGSLTAEGYMLQPGGELWVRIDGVITEFSGIARAASGEGTTMRAFYYKGGRLEITSQEGLDERKQLEFRTWSAEPGGWLVLSVDEGVEATPPVAVEVRTVTPSG